MKYIRTFESFVTDDNRGEDTQYPQHNAALKSEVVEYVDTILNSNEYSKLVDLLGMELPKNVSGEEVDKFFDEVREEAIKHFMANPEQLGKAGGFVINKFNVSGGDGIARTNNIGGVVKESLKPKPNTQGCKVLEVTDDQLAYFEDESPLLKLIRDEKVTLYDNQIWYNKDDKETIDVLDVYFEL
jgi:hypothetical protein